MPVKLKLKKALLYFKAEPFLFPFVSGVPEKLIPR